MTYMTTHTYHTATYYRIRTAVRLAFLAGVALTAFTIGKALASEPYPYKCDGTTVVVAGGDTLWSLAEEHCEGHTGHAVDRLVATYGTDIHPGDTLSFSIESER